MDDGATASSSSGIVTRLIEDPRLATLSVEWSKRRDLLCHLARPLA